MPVSQDSQSIVAVIRDLLADALGVPAAEISEHKTFFELGLTSRIGVIWMARVNEAYGLIMPAVRAYSYPTLDKLAGRIREELTAQAAGATSATKAPMRFGRRGKSARPALASTTGDGVNVGPKLRVTPFLKTKAPDSNRSVMAGSDPASATQLNPRVAQNMSVKHDQTAIAIVGLSGRFPRARNTTEFWQAIIEGRDCISHVSRKYWNMSVAYSPLRQPDRAYSDWLGALDDIDQFDPLFFSISPADANCMDPQQRLFLQEAWHCLEDAGYRPDTLAGSKCGVFVGCGTYGQSQNGNDLSAAGFLGASPSILAARIAYLLDLRGPCLTIDTACSASLVAIAQACDSLVLGSSDLALAGGVSVMVDPSIHIMASQAGMLSPDGRCFSFDQRANGFVPGEGIGVVALKRVADALRDNDHIYGTLIGWGVNQDGKTNGITAPSQTSQRDLQEAVFRKFAIDPRSIGLVEAHGSGTKLGDPIEVAALIDAFRPFTADVGYCALGSVKSNMGHLLAAAGVAGFLKALLALKHRTLPPTIHFETLNEHIALDDSPFFINTVAQDWPAGPDARRAAVSSFGFSGTNAYVVLEEYPATPRSVMASTPEVVVLSAQNEERLCAYAEALLAAIRRPASEGERLRIDDIAYTLQVGRMTFGQRLAIVAASLDELSSGLMAFLKGQANSATVFHGCSARDGTMLIGKDDIPVLVDRWLAGGKLEAVARCWVQYGFDWCNHQAWRKDAARRISLPTYPFEPRLCDMPVFQPARRRDEHSAISPLLQSNLSTFDHVVFSSTFNGSEFYFADHVIAGHKILPGVAYLDMACAAGCVASGERVAGLKNIVWLRPFQVDTAPATLVIRLERKNGRTGFSIYERSDGAEQLCAQGELVLGATPPLERHAPDARLTGAALLDRQESCYQRFKAQGFAYGPTFRGIRTLHQSGRDIIAYIERPGDDRAEADVQGNATLAGHYRLLDGFVLHPGLLDSAFQPCIRFCEEQDPSRTYIPYALAEITVFDGLPARFYSIATLKHIDDENAHFSIVMVDESGKLLVRVDDLMLRPIKTDRGAQAAADVPFHLYRLDWAEAPSNVAAVAALPDELRLVFLPAGVSRDGITREHDIVVYPGSRFRAAGERCYEIAPQSAADYARLWNEVTQPGQLLTTAHCWALADDPADAGRVAVADQLARSLYSLMQIGQQFVRQRAFKQSRLFYFHAHASGNAVPAYLAMGGLLRSLAAEQPELLVRSIGYEAMGAHALANVGALLQRELVIPHHPGEAVEIRYAKDRRFVLTAKCVTNAATEPADAAPTASGGSPVSVSGLRTGGTYLISGGAGGLGLLLAEMLVRRYDAQVVLAGRTPFARLPEQTRARILALEETRAHYVVADITRADSVAALVDTVKARCQRINGVFHCAGAMANAAVVDKTAAAIAQIVEPKVLGAILLDQATQHEALDMFVLYSSIASVMRFAGQTDYAYANRFLDGFAAQRQSLVRAGLRHGRTLAINWTLWRDGGMELDESKVRYLERGHGLVPLDAETGLDALEACLSSIDDTKSDQLVVVRGRAATIEANWPECLTHRVAVPPLIDRPAAAASKTNTVVEGAGGVRGRVLAELAALLKLEPADIDPDENLMRYGLDSINAMMLINKINDSFDVSVQPATLLRHPTLSEFAAHFEADYLPARTAAERDRLAENSATFATDEPTAVLAPSFRPPSDAAPSIAVAPLPAKGEAYPDPYLNPFAVLPNDETAAGAWPMTCGQHALWFLHQFNETSSAYHIAVAFRVRSPLDVRALEQSYAGLMRRHPALRARFHEEEGRPVQSVRTQLEPDFRHLDCAGQTLQQVLEAMQEAHRRPFDLTRDALSRMRLFVLGERDAFVLWTVHHLVSDAWSQWVLLEELLASYGALCRGQTPALAELPRTFADFAHEEARFLKSEAGGQQLAFWQRQLDGEIPLLNLPTDYPRPAVQTFNGASIPVVCNATLSNALKQFARQQGVTPFTTLLAAYQCLLGRYSGDRKIWVGSPVSGRIDERYTDLVGYFINSVVLTADLGENPAFDVFLQQQQRVVLDALENQRTPFSILVQHLNPSREGGRAPLFQAEFVYQKAHNTGELVRILSPEAALAIRHQDLQLESVAFAQQEGQTDICLEMTEIDERYVGVLKFNSDLFAPATMTRIRDSFVTLLAGCIEHPQTPVRALPIVSAQDFSGGTLHLEGPFIPPSGLTVTQLFERQTGQLANAHAVVDSVRTWTYAELNERANRLARHLRARGLALGQRVGICMQRSADVIATLLAVLKAGGTYVPMDPMFPVDRLQLMLDDAVPAFVVTDQASSLPVGLRFDRASLIDLAAEADGISRRHGGNLSAPGDMDDIAYVIYTSGSTGRPKGIQISHRALSNFLQSMRDKPGILEQDRLLAVTTISFDIAGLEIYLPLITGATVVLASREDAMDGFALQRLLRDHQITMMQATPTTWQMLLESGWEGEPGLTILCGGEPLSRVLALRLLRCSTHVWNLYGPTETTIWSCIARVVADGDHAIEPIGEPIANTSIYILDDELKPVPNGMIGELCIGGDGVAVGYLNRPELNAEKFVRTGAGLLYRSGDQARLMSDGQLVFHGRADNQLKIRGFRVEAGEIEHVIRADQRIADCVVTVCNRSVDGSLEHVLTAYLVLVNKTPLTDALRSELRERLARALPAYMVPSIFMALDALPLTPNNKVDRKALPQPDVPVAAAPARRQNTTAPGDTRLAKIWGDVLQLDQVAHDCHFFHSGGTSFTASRLMYLLRRDMELVVPVSLLFEHPTLNAFSNQVRTLANATTLQTATQGVASAPEEYAECITSDTSDPLLDILMRVQRAELSIDHANRLIEEFL
ncbi:non-ribosomal peptide synthetase [Mycoavidus sp. HKI]|uniref:non-ribosomal peptide synthetase n=1 Tax=Mycoavidus sp. HKI TaxID=2840467 RepID=UPI001CBDD964|nr:non-ribosomal peptide synthetase [Mycoavidus sp. HKI]UAW64147.1 non-ribosomal peptide synthetase [Mycoavidus sp. HKI]